jgi:hypothetical protein
MTRIVRASLALSAALLALAFFQPAFAGGVSGTPGTLDATLVDPPTSAQYPHVIVSGTAPVSGTVAASNLPATVDTGAGAATANTPRGVLTSDGQSVVSVGPYPYGATPVTNEATATSPATVTATLPAAAGKTTYMTGCVVSGTGSTAGGFADVSIYMGGTAKNLDVTIAIPAGVSTALTPLVLNFNPPLSAGAANNAIQCIATTFGSGNTLSRVSTWGFQF